jgi:hypothetical protein
MKRRTPLKNGADQGVLSPRGRQPEVPQAKSITKQNIETAYASDHGRTQRRRINAFGEINREVLKDLGAEIVRSRQ